MKKLIFILFATFLFQGTALAQQDGKGVEKAKSKILQRIQEKRRLINNFESCVSSAGSRADLKSCRQQNKSAMKSFREKNKEMREQFREERKQRKAERRSQRQ